MDLGRRLVILSMLHNFVVRARHVPEVSNAIADALSRFQMQQIQMQLLRVSIYNEIKIGFNRPTD